MFSVALIGPDGAGKTTIGRRLEHNLPLPVKYVYMGINPEASNVMLPTTRAIRAIKRACGAPPDVAGPRDPNRIKARPRSLTRRATRGVKASLRLANRIAEEWYRQLLTWRYQRQGMIVLFDRHFFSDYYAYDIADGGRERPLTDRIHGWLLNKVYPRPSLVIYLDAPADVLFARKREGTLEALERRRHDYLQMRALVKHFEVVDANQPEDDVARAVTGLIWDFYQARTGRSLQVRDDQI